MFGVDAFALVPDTPRPIHEAMLGYWTRLAAKGDPNGNGAETWPAFDTASEENILLDLPLSVVTNHAEARCDFWDSIL